MAHDNSKFYYFGCIGNVGHHMHKAGSYLTDNDFTYSNPWGASVDGKLCLKHQKPWQEQGVALVHNKDGWTALSFWDRSVDKRMGSSSNFLAEGHFTFDEMVSLARLKFPNVMDRFSFPIKQAGDA